MFRTLYPDLVCAHLHYNTEVCFFRRCIFKQFFWTDPVNLDTFQNAGKLTTISYTVVIIHWCLGHAFSTQFCEGRNPYTNNMFIYCNWDISANNVTGSVHLSLSIFPKSLLESLAIIRTRGDIQKKIWSRFLTFEIKDHHRPHNCSNNSFYI